MPPAFNLSQDQTLQFNACYCFLFLRIGRSLNVLTSSSHLLPKEKTLKTYLNTSVRLDTFAYTINPKINRSVRTPSAHTYRLLVFKEHSLTHQHRLSGASCFLRRCICSRETRLCRTIRISSTGFLPLRDNRSLLPGLADFALRPVLPGFAA